MQLLLYNNCFTGTFTGSLTETLDFPRISRDFPRIFLNPLEFPLLLLDYWMETPLIIYARRDGALPQAPTFPQLQRAVDNVVIFEKPAENSNIS